MLVYVIILAAIIATLVIVFHYFLYGGTQSPCITYINIDENDAPSSIAAAIASTSETSNEGLSDVVSMPITPNKVVTRAEHNKYLWNGVQSADRATEPFGLEPTKKSSFVTPYRLITPASEAYQSANSMIMKSKFGQ